MRIPGGSCRPPRSCAALSGPRSTSPGPAAARSTPPAEPYSVGIVEPFDDRVIHEIEIAGGGIATSGVGSRLWADGSGGHAHHLLDPATGEPAWTGVVLATALAPTTLEAEAL